LQRERNKTTIKLTQEGDWVVFSTNNQPLIKLFKSQIPTEYRKFEDYQWLVYWTKLPELVIILAKFYNLDYSNLPSKWQMFIAGAKVDAVSKPSNLLQAYETLHLLPSAPIELVKTVYSLLVFKYHPDHNDGQGDTKRLNEILKAYKEIKNNTK
jgi:hypothetical protein